MHKIAALFIENNSIYKGYDFIDCYDKDRDARSYNLDLPVIAHPPCQLWGSLSFVNYKRWGGDHNKPGNDGGLFEFALNTVRRCGGVLEHPANSRAWNKYSLIKPDGVGWQKCLDGGWVCEVWQSAYGHLANKATWLYCIGEPVKARTETPAGSHQIGGECTQGKVNNNKPTLKKSEVNKTPQEFAEFLIEIALKQRE